jgi:hypothetical protein
VRICTYMQAHDARVQARYTLLYDAIGAIMGGSAFKVFFSANKIKAALRRNAAEKRMREHHATRTAAHIMQQVLGRYGPERMLQLLPYINGYTMQHENTEPPFYAFWRVPPMPAAGHEDITGQLRFRVGGAQWVWV